MRYPGIISLNTASWDSIASFRITGSFGTGFGCDGVENSGRENVFKRRRRPSYRTNSLANETESGKEIMHTPFSGSAMIS